MDRILRDPPLEFIKKLLLGDVGLVLIRKFKVWIAKTWLKPLAKGDIRNSIGTQNTVFVFLEIRLSVIILLCINPSYTEEANDLMEGRELRGINPN